VAVPPQIAPVGAFAMTWITKLKNFHAAAPCRMAATLALFLRWNRNYDSSIFAAWRSISP
jgi:hypothetical protein